MIAINKIVKYNNTLKENRFTKVATNKSARDHVPNQTKNTATIRGSLGSE